MHDIEQCRTSALGGHLEECDHCGHERPAYNSCRNRHCPKCQSLAKARWLEGRKAELLPVKYFHNVFTLPHELNPLILCNEKVLLNLFFHATSETLQEFGADPKHHLGGQLGFLSILHTWSQTLLDHFHLHVVIPAGALSFDGQQWIGVKGDYLFNVEALSGKYRGKYLDGLNKAYLNGELQSPGNTANLKHPVAFQALLDTLYGKEWVVFSKASFDRPDYVLDYLGRYTYRIAIENHRILSIEAGHVVFSYKNRKAGTHGTMRLSADEFIRRFLLHVLPKGFVRIRFYGFLAHNHKAEKLNLIHKALGIEEAYQKPTKKSPLELMIALLGEEWNSCPVCKKGKTRKSKKILNVHLPDALGPEFRTERNHST